MAKTGSSIEVEILANTKKYDAETKRLVNDAKNLQKSLAIDFDGKQYAEAQKLMREAIDRTEKKAAVFRDELKKLEDAGKIDTDDYNKLSSKMIKAEAEAVQLKQQLKELNQVKMDNLVNGFKNVGDSFTKAGQALLPFSAAAAGILTGMAAIGKSTIESADNLKTFADRVNLSAEELQKWQYIAMQTDVTNEELQAGLVKAQGAFASLAKGDIDVMSQALMDLGFSAEDATKGMGANFDDLVNKLAGIEDPIIQAAYANEIFGERMGAKLIPMLKAGGEGLAELAKEYENFDTLTNDQIDSLADFDNVLNNLKFSFKTIKDQIGMALLPVMESLAEMVNTKIVPVVRSLAEWFSNLSDIQKNVMVGVLGLVAALAPVLLIAGKLTSGIGSMIGMVGKLSASFSSMGLALGPIAAIAALFALLYSTNENFRNSINSLVQTLGSALMPILSVLGNVFETVLKAIMPIVDILGNMLATRIQYLVTVFMPFIGLLTNILVPVLNVVLSVFQTLLGFVLGPLSIGFKWLSDLLIGIFKGVQTFIQGILDFVGNAVNKAIDWINAVIRNINKIGDVLGFTVGEIENVKIQLETGQIPEPEVVATSTPTSVPVNQAINNNTSQQVTNNMVTYNNDNSQKDITINVTVENYAEELDYDDLAEKINLKLAEVW
jgi:hypothetical protein